MATQDQTLLHLQEQFALYKHIQTYHWLADTYNWKEMAKLFSENTDFEFEVVQGEGEQVGKITLQNQVTRGAEAVVAMLDMLTKPYKKSQHIIMNTNFNINGKTATGTANIAFWGVPDPAKAYLYDSMGSRYHWKFRKEGDVWKTTYTKVEKIWESTTRGV